MLSIYQEIEQVASGDFPQQDNPLVSAPHTAEMATSDHWEHPYSRNLAIYPSEFTRQNKYWPPVGRLDNVYGDRNLVCSCPSIEDYQ